MRIICPERGDRARGLYISDILIDSLTPDIINLYNEIYKLKQKNCDLQNTVEKLKYDLSIINKKELTIEPEIDELPGLEAPCVSIYNDLILIDHEN